MDPLTLIGLSIIIFYIIIALLFIGIIVYIIFKFWYEIVICIGIGALFLFVVLYSLGVLL
jgi:hypothetical protein